MALYVTGKVKQGLFHTVAYKLYDSKSRESTIMSREDIILEVKKGRRIIGFKQNEYTEKVVINPEISNIKHLSCLGKDGKRKSNSVHTLVLIEVYDFEDKVEILCVDAEDKLYILNLHQIKQWLLHDYIVGLSEVGEQYIIHHSEYDNRVYLKPLLSNQTPA
ncbi:hypothetical protein [Konateibacter massiliensis]|uniref:hypothetical protein n=1 Tax=Konateibacter massiliensis TaxID=2002841 RepID=UPI000C1508C2|nr:hypothetical protein [Konateibacter massiliensis]